MEGVSKEVLGLLDWKVSIWRHLWSSNCQSSHIYLPPLSIQGQCDLFWIPAQYSSITLYCIDLFIGLCPLVNNYTQQEGFQIIYLWIPSTYHSARHIVCLNNECLNDSINELIQRARYFLKNRSELKESDQWVRNGIYRDGICKVLWFVYFNLINLQNKLVR